MFQEKLDILFCYVYSGCIVFCHHEQHKLFLELTSMRASENTALYFELSSVVQVTFPVCLQNIIN